MMTDLSRNDPLVPTLETVAARAGVSRATVSRVINKLDRVAPHVIESVNAAVAELGYVPNRAARSLARRRTNVIAVVFPEPVERVFANPFFSALVQGAAHHVRATDYTLNLVLAAEYRSEKSRRYLTGGNVDGALIVSQHEDDFAYTELGLTIPLVFAGRPLIDYGGNGHFVDVDNIAAAKTAVRYIIETGRKKIATVSGPQDLAAGRDRLIGWRAALHEHDLDDSLQAEGAFTPESGAAAMEALLATGKPIDAVFAANDQMAFGVQTTLTQAGLRIPQDVAVVGFDDDQYSRTARPQITTIQQPAREMGAKMAEILHERINGRKVPRVTLLPTKLIPRDST